MFYIHIFFLTRLDHLIFFFFIMGLKLKVKSRTHDYRWSIDLMIVFLYSYLWPFYSGLLSDSKVPILYADYNCHHRII